MPHLKDGLGIFDMEKKKLAGKVKYRQTTAPQFTTTHGRYWMQNAPYEIVKKAYADWR